MQSYAVKHYEACLSLAAIERQTWHLSRMQVDSSPAAEQAEEEEEGDDDDVDEPSDFARVAAYNLSNLYMLSGNAELARAVARRWLAV